MTSEMARLLTLRSEISAIGSVVDFCCQLLPPVRRTDGFLVGVHHPFDSLASRRLGDSTSTQTRQERPYLLQSLRKLALALALLPLPALAQSDIDVDVTYSTYELDSDTLPDIQAEMNAIGPYGFPAYTTWYVNWTAACDLTVTASIILPDLGLDADLSPEDEATFRTMLENLEAHEYNHVELGVGYAEEVQAMGCRGDTASLLQEYLAEERQYDTDHGRTEGAWLITD